MSELEAWLYRAVQIDRRRASAVKYEAARKHAGLFPTRDVLALELDRSILGAALEMIAHSGRGEFVRPPRGLRGGHWTTQAVVDLNNRLMQLGKGNA